MTTLERQLSELEARVAQLRESAREAATAASAQPKEPGGALGSEWKDRDSFSVPESAKILRMSTWWVYEAIKRGDIPVVRFGRAIRIGRRTIERMLGAA